MSEIGSTACLAMELADGRSLSASIPVRGIPAARLLVPARELLKRLGSRRMPA